MLGSFDVCDEPTDFYLLASALRSFFVVIGTHLLSGEVDSTLDEGNMVQKLSWLVRYFNPVNLSWRYYSILAYRVAAKRWGEKQLALVNFEAHPYEPPIPYVLGEVIEDYRVKRLEVSGLLSSQGLLSVSAAYQGVLAVQYTISTAGIAFLPNLTMPFAILGLFRAMVSRWIANKVFVEPFPYPSPIVTPSDYKANKLVGWVWLGVLISLVLLSFWPYKAYPAFHLPADLLELNVQIFYQYLTLSELAFHAVLLLKGAVAFGNRIVFFDHWVYKLQTAGFLVLLTETLVIGIVDFIRHDYYRSCA